MIETIIAAFAFGTIWFWLLALIASIVFIASIENDVYAPPIITAIFVGALCWKSIAALSWQTIIIFIIAYAIAGILWSLFKWYRYVNKIAASYKNPIYNNSYETLKSRISVSDNKSRLIGWIALWPWSLVWSVTGDFFNMLYETMISTYQKITDKALGRFDIKNNKMSE
jgi:hypothetical protein